MKTHGSSRYLSRHLGGGTLYNVVLPLFFCESISILLAFLGVVAIEAFVSARKLRMPFREMHYMLAGVNFVTTVIGYFMQGLLRLSAFIGYTSSLPRHEISALYGNYLINGAAANIGAGTEDGYGALTEIIIGFLIAFVISVIVETRVLRNEFKNDIERYNLVPVAVMQANAVSYVCLFAWVLISLKLVHAIP